MNRNLYLLVLFIFLFSCEKSRQELGDLFTIGLTFGECLGDCHSFYKLHNEELFADNCEFCNPPDGIVFQMESIRDSEKIDRLSNLKENIPVYLLLSEDTIFGCPDCGDWGAIHVILAHEGEEQKHYTLDNQIEGNPEELRAFALKVRETVLFLNN